MQDLAYSAGSCRRQGSRMRERTRVRPAIVRLSRRLSAGLGGLLLLAASAQGPALAGDFEAGRAKAAKCKQCHGLDGLGKLPIYPNIAGQSAVYLAQQLRNYRDGQRQNDMMSFITKELSDADIDDLAEYFSRIQIEVKVPE